MSNTNNFDFSLLLASSVHDIKNSLGMLLASLDEMIDLTQDERPEYRQNFSVLRGEASRINNSLVYLLGLYHLQNQQLAVNLNEVFVAEFLEEQVESQQLLFDINNVEVTIDCDEGLVSYFDNNLVAGVIGNILVNCAKYTRDKIAIKASIEDSHFKLSIIDNGSGYPQAIIDNLSAGDRSINFDTGSTNLGLYFSQQIAQVHECDGRRGYIELSNTAEGGGCFSLYLP